MTPGGVVALAAGATGLWLLFRKKPKAAPCPVDDFVKLHEWSVEYGRTGLYAPGIPNNPPALNDLLATYPSFQEVPVNTIFIVTKSGNFWRYDAQGKAWAAPELRASYCAWVNR
jgi:hypothetical protein